MARKKITEEQKAAIAECERRGIGLPDWENKPELAVRALRNQEKIQPLTDVFFVRRRRRNYWTEGRLLALLRDVVESAIGDDEQYADRHKVKQNGLEFQYVLNIRRKRPFPHTTQRPRKNAA